MEREKERAKKDAPDLASSASPSTLLDKATPDGQPAPGAARRPDDPARTPADEIDSLRVDMPNTVGSESSHTSIASSATNASLHVNNAALSKNNSYSHVTPLTIIDSPSSSAGHHPTKPDTSFPPHPDKTNGVALKPDGFLDSGAAMKKPDISRRIPARDPSLPVQVIKAAHDPTIDRSSRDKKKPKYKEFGLVRKYIYSVRQGERHLHMYGFGTFG